MKTFLVWVIILAAAVWIVDSSGCGYNKWTQVGNDAETQRLLGYQPIQAFIHTDKKDSLLPDYASCRDLIIAMGKRKKATRYSILGRQLDDKDAPKPTNYVWLRFSNHEGFQPWIKWGDPVQDLGPDCADVIKDVVWRNNAAEGYQPPIEPDFTRLKL